MASTITKMNLTDCHAPWQTETDWYLVEASGDGCDFIVVKGWRQVIATLCRLIVGGTIEEALQRNADELLGYATDLADGDKWSAHDNCQPARPHRFEGAGYCFTWGVTMLTEPPQGMEAAT